MIREAIKKVAENEDLTREEAYTVMNEIMSGECTDAQIACFITSLRHKTESVEEIVGCAEVMREKATKINAPRETVDIVGTGGDSQHTFNISTASSIVAAAAGVIVAKHGNRSVSSTSGSADVLKTLGVNIEADVKTVEKCIAEAGIGFMFAPLMHGAMKYAIGPRREIGIRTIFNILGPLTNPAGAPRQLLGVYASHLAPTLAMVLRDLGSEHVMVVHGHDGLDEITISDETTVAELKNGDVNEYVIAPDEFGLKTASLDAIRVNSSEESAKMVLDVLRGASGPARDVVLLNAGAAVYVAGKAEDHMAGVEMAADVIDSGKAEEKLSKLIDISNS
ncbi:MAG: anthranilate phosphoribosyltransferase [Planctomycetes bacterium]|nr:anthranilate phosphoribosyltransferase [Planctomycetota bacterium]